MFTLLSPPPPSPSSFLSPESSSNQLRKGSAEGASAAAETGLAPGGDGGHGHAAVHSHVSTSHLAGAPGARAVASAQGASVPLFVSVLPLAMDARCSGETRDCAGVQTLLHSEESEAIRHPILHG
jgi:hypothetical protein